MKANELRLPVVFDFLADNGYIPLGLGDVVVNGVHVPLGNFQMASGSGGHGMADMLAETFFVQRLADSQEGGAGLAVENGLGAPQLLRASAAARESGRSARRGGVRMVSVLRDA